GQVASIFAWDIAQLVDHTMKDMAARAHPGDGKHQTLLIHPELELSAGRIVQIDPLFDDPFLQLCHALLSLSGSLRWLRLNPRRLSSDTCDPRNFKKAPVAR